MIGNRKTKLQPRGIQKNHIFRGVDEKLKELIYSFSDVLVYYDPDVDGCIAGMLVCKFLAKHGIKFQWYINSNRSHDWSIPVEKLKEREIIAVDFIVYAEKVRELSLAGCKFVSMDHHNNRDEYIEYIGSEGNRCLVINNQYPFEEESSRYLSGAGVVFETLIQIDPEFDTEDNRALVGITLLSDVRDIENPYAEDYLYRLYSHKYKGYIKYLIDSTMGEIDYGFGLPKMDRNYVDYKFSPAINAMLRFDRQDEVVPFFLGQGNLDLTCRDEQKALVKNISETIKVVDFSNLRVCYFNEKDFLNYQDVLSSFVGLTASRYLDGVHSVICYMIAENEAGGKSIKRASLRGNINGLDYRNGLLSLGEFKCLGHASAFGIKDITPSKELFKKCNRVCAEIEKQSGWKRDIREVVNMSFFVNNNAYKIAEDNMYKLAQNQTYIRYVGTDIKRKHSGANYAEYLVNGIPVKCFDLKLTFEEGLIMPILDRGLLTFVLE